MAAAITVNPEVPAYPPAGLSRLLARVDTLPWHGWWVFPVLYVGLVALGQVILWITGLRPIGTIDTFLLAGVVYAPYTLLAVQYVNRASERALAAFWPATGWPEAQQSAWRYQFVNSPAGYGLPGFVFGAIVAIAGYLSLPTHATGTGMDRVIYFIAYLPASVAGYWCALLIFIHTMRQLRLVERIHREATAIDPFDRGPVYAFSGLTARTGLMYVLIGYYTLTFNWNFQVGNVAGLLVLSAVFVLGIACFVVPLWGIHTRLVGEKDRLLRDVDQRMRSAGAQLYERVDTGAFDAGKAINDTLAGLRIVRERIRELPTWPWPPNLLRGFLTALLLPVIVYLLSRAAAGAVHI